MKRKSKMIQFVYFTVYVYKITHTGIDHFWKADAQATVTVVSSGAGC